MTHHSSDLPVTDKLFSYRGKTYPDHIRRGNTSRFIFPVAQEFCVGDGVDVGGGNCPFPGARLVDPRITGEEYDAYNLPGAQEFDYIFSSHCLEHLDDPISALEHWHSRLRFCGALFLYLPHPEMEYWRPENNRKHRHCWTPERMAEILTTLGFVNFMTSGRDLAWSFAAVGFK